MKGFVHGEVGGGRKFTGYNLQVIVYSLQFRKAEGFFTTLRFIQNDDALGCNGMSEGFY